MERETLLKRQHAGGVETFVMVSSDKAVNPTSVMGASKRIAEMVVQNIDKKSDTRFVVVRFGNVLGSRGSVFHYLRNKLEKADRLRLLTQIWKGTL